MEPIKLDYSEQLIHQVMRSYWRRKIGLGLPIVTLLMVGMLIYFISNGDRSWLIGAMGTAVFMSFATMVAVYLVHLNRSLKRLRRMNQPAATLELLDKRFRISSDVGLSELEWSQVNDIWQFEKAWLVFLSPNGFITLPTANMSAEAKAFIIAKTRV